MNSLTSNKINQVSVVTFSPTGTSRKIALAIASGMGVEEPRLIDLTYEQENQDLAFTPDDVVIVAMPVYGGRVAPLAMKRMEELVGNGTRAVAVVVYGNRHYENALNELGEVLAKKDFCTIAAGTFIGEHSYSTPETPIAVGRPNADDLNFAIKFGEKIVEKLSSSSEKQAVDTTCIEQPIQDAEVMMKFKSTIKAWMEEGVYMPKTPMMKAEECQQCGMCVNVCPTKSIDSLTLDIDGETCIKCCACVKACVFNARYMPTPFAPLISENFAQQKENKVLL